MKPSLLELGDLEKAPMFGVLRGLLLTACFFGIKTIAR